VEHYKLKIKKRLNHLRLRKKKIDNYKPKIMKTNQTSTNLKRSIMKKLILIAVTLIVSASCSKDEKYDVTQDTSYFNLANDRFRGVWYFDKVIKADGSIQNYIHTCPFKKDYVDFHPIAIKDYLHFEPQNCEYITQPTHSLNFQTTGYTISNCSEFYNGTYTFPGNTLQVNYPSPRTLTYSNLTNTNNIKGIIFSRN
jgi:hypothetical protein